MCSRAGPFTGILHPRGRRLLFFVVKKDTDELRMVVDYRAVNARLLRDAFTLPRIEQLLNQLHGSSYFTKLDLAQAFH